jgi:hypothetical protein
MINRRRMIALAGGLLAAVVTRSTSIAGSFQVIENLKLSTPTAKNGAAWQFVADGVMGGLSKGTMVRETIGGRNALRMRGTVSLENNGGFIQVALDLSPDGSPIDASAFSGVEIDVIGNGETYNLHLRTADLSRPWQSYRHSFDAGRNWETHRLPFADFNSYRTGAPLDLTKLRRIGFVAIGRAFKADIAIGGIRFDK